MQRMHVRLTRSTSALRSRFMRLIWGEEWDWHYESSGHVLLMLNPYPQPASGGVTELVPIDG